MGKQQGTLYDVRRGSKGRNGPGREIRVAPHTRGTGTAASSVGSAVRAAARCARGRPVLAEACAGDRS